MTRTSLILVLRLCLVAAVALWLGVPWWVVVSLMMPVFAAASGCPTICSAVPEGTGTLSVTTGGITNGTCTGGNCNDANRTWVLNCHNCNCGGSGTLAPTGCDGLHLFNLPGGAQFSTSGGNTVGSTAVSVTDGINTWTASYSVIIGAAPADCTPPFALSYSGQSGTVCDGSGGSVTFV